MSVTADKEHADDGENEEMTGLGGVAIAKYLSTLFNGMTEFVATTFPETPPPNEV